MSLHDFCGLVLIAAALVHFVALCHDPRSPLEDDFEDTDNFPMDGP